MLRIFKNQQSLLQREDVPTPSVGSECSKLYRVAFGYNQVFGWVLVLLLLLVTKSAHAQSSYETIENTLPRVVKIFGAGGLKNLHAYSTGFLISPAGHIATIWSHVLDREQVVVVLNDGRRFAAKVVNAEPSRDVALLQILANGETLDLPHFDLDRVRDVSPGTRILGFSNAFKVATGDEPVSVIHGVVSARTRLSARRGTFTVDYDFPVYVVDGVTNNSGAGGGVIMSYDGALVAMIGKELQNAESHTWVNYALPMTELRDVLAQMINGDFRSQNKPTAEDRPPRYRPIDFGLVMIPDILYRTPAYIDEVLPDSSAFKAGCRRGDLILFVNNELTHSCRQLKSIMGKLESGDPIELILRRKTELVTATFHAE